MPSNGSSQATALLEGEASTGLSLARHWRKRHRSMLLVAGLSLKNLKPRVWDVHSPYYLSDVQAVMVSYADFHRMPAQRRGAMEEGLHAYLTNGVSL